MKIDEFINSKKFRIGLYILVAVIILLFAFQAGVWVGYKKAMFSYSWGENYHRNFGGPREGITRRFMSRENFANPNGAFGKIIKIELPSIIIQGEKESEKSVLINDDTVIRRFREIIKKEDIKVGERSIVIGEPNASGQIEAKLIRLLPK